MARGYYYDSCRFYDRAYRGTRLSVSSPATSALPPVTPPGPSAEGSPDGKAQITPAAKHAGENDAAPKRLKETLPQEG